MNWIDRNINKMYGRIHKLESEEKKKEWLDEVFSKENFDRVTDQFIKETLEECLSVPESMVKINTKMQYHYEEGFIKPKLYIADMVLCR